VTESCIVGPFNLSVTFLPHQHLTSRDLRSVRNGRTLTVLDRDTTVARIVPYAAPPLEIRKAQRRVRDVKLPPKPAKRTDSVAVLLEDRRRR